MSFRKLFEGSDEVSIDSNRVLIPALNGNSFIQKNKIIFDIPPNHQFISLRECYLEFDVALNNNDEGYEMPGSGAQRLIKTCRIQTKDGKVLENCVSYNVMAEFMYHYALTSGEKDSRSLTELAAPDEFNNGNFLSSKIIVNPFSQPYDDGQVESTAKKNIKQRVVLKLWSKVFDNYDTDVVFPNVFTGGLQVHVELEDNARVLKVIPQLNSDDTTFCCRTHGAINAASNPHTTIEVKNDVDRGINAQQNDMKGSPFNVGMRVRIQKADGTSPDNTATIQSIQVNGSNRYELRLSAGFNASTDYPDGSFIGAVTADLDATYTITDPAISVAVCNVPDAWKNGLIDLVAENKFRYNLKAIENVQVSQSAGQTNFTNYINSNANSVSSILCLPVDSQTAATYTNELMDSVYDNYDNYQYGYENSVHPTLPVDTQKLSNTIAKVSAPHLTELMKGLDSFWGSKNLRRFKTNFGIARQFAPYGGAMSLTMKDLSHKISLKSGSSLTTNTNYNNYLVKNLQLVVSKDGTQIIG
jgi:hypothetical protein